MGNETVNSKSGKLFLNFSNTNSKPAASVLSPSRSSVAAGSFVTRSNSANITESLCKDDDMLVIAKGSEHEQNIPEVDNQNIQFESKYNSNGDAVADAKEPLESPENIIVNTSKFKDTIEGNPGVTNRDIITQITKEKPQSDLKGNITMKPQDAKEILSAVTYSANENNNLFDDSDSSSDEEAESVDEKDQLKKLKGVNQDQSKIEVTKDKTDVKQSDTDNKLVKESSAQRVDSDTDQKESSALKQQSKNLGNSKSLKVDTLQVKDADNNDRTPATPTVHKESKARIINRVQVAAKSKNELKMQEKEINEKFQKDFAAANNTIGSDITADKSSGFSTDNRKPTGKKVDLHKATFDFQKFLAILKTKNADPIVKYSKSFLNGFSKRNWTVSEQIKLISDFKNFIYDKMSQTPSFSNMNEQEFMNCQEGMEKLIMNRLYDQVFSPVIPRGKLSKSHMLDLKKDDRLNNQILRFNWISKKHLDLDFDDSFDLNNFKKLATAELIKINNYRSPRDKIICVLNSCKVISGILKQCGMESNADYFIPLLIYVVLQTDEDLKLNSNISYIERFRMENALVGEVSYYLSSFWAVIGFIENLNKESLCISQEEWDSHMSAYANGDDLNYEEEEAALELEIQKEQSNRSHIEPEGSSNNASNPLSSLLQPLQSFFSQSNIAEKFDILSDDDSQTKEHEANTSSTSNHQDSFLSNPIKAAFGTSNVSVKTEEEIGKKKDAKRKKKAMFLAQQAYEIDIENVTSNLSEMFPTLEKELIRDIVVANKGNSNLAAEQLIEML